MVVFRYRTGSQSDSDGSLSSSEGLHAQPAPIKCRWENCGEWFSQLELLAGHVTSKHAVPGKGGLFYCHWESCNRADRGFNARYKMLVHMRTHTNEKPHHCFQCDKSFSRAENLKIHARSHTGERPYVCPVAGCGKAYSNSSDRFKHTRTHSVDKPYVCKVAGCSKRYTDPSSLRKHVKTYKHYPNATIKVSEPIMKIENDSSKDSWKSDLEKRLSIPTNGINPSIISFQPSSPDMTQMAYTPSEDSQTMPFIIGACYDRNTVLMSNQTPTKQVEPFRMCIDANLPNISASIKQNNLIHTNYTDRYSPICNGSNMRGTPNYAEQVRRSMSPPLYIEDERSVNFEALTPPTPSQSYYFFYSYPETSNFTQEQEMPLDLSVNH